MVSRNKSQTTTRRHLPVSSPAPVGMGIMLTVVAIADRSHRTEQPQAPDVLREDRGGELTVMVRTRTRPACTHLRRAVRAGRSGILQDPLLGSGSRAGFSVKPDGMTGWSFARFADVAGRNW